MLMADSITIYRDAGKPDQAVPVTNECASPGAFTPGEVLTSSSPAPRPKIDGNADLAGEIPWPELWPARHNQEIWSTGPDGSYAWRNQSDGLFTDTEHVSTAVDTRIEIRPPCLDDLAGILTLVRSCTPYLTVHARYVYWMQIRQHGEHSAVALLNGKIAGWCSVVRGMRGRCFVHQLGVAEETRRQGIARTLLKHVVTRVNEEPDTSEIEFTIDRGNSAALALVKAVAADTGTLLSRSMEPVQLLDEDCGQDLYTMTRLANRHNDASDEVPNALWTTTEKTEATVTIGSNF